MVDIHCTGHTTAIHPELDENDHDGGLYIFRLLDRILSRRSRPEKAELLELISEYRALVRMQELGLRHDGELMTELHEVIVSVVESAGTLQRTVDDDHQPAPRSPQSAVTRQDSVSTHCEENTTSDTLDVAENVRQSADTGLPEPKVTDHNIYSNDYKVQEHVRQSRNTECKDTQGRKKADSHTQTTFMTSMKVPA